MSKVTTNSDFSARGFLKSIPIGFPPACKTLIGPYGWGAVECPWRMQPYSIPSGDTSLRIALLNPMLLGSNLTFTFTSSPSLVVAGWAWTFGASVQKFIGPSSFSILTAYWVGFPFKKWVNL